MREFLERREKSGNWESREKIETKILNYFNSPKYFFDDFIIFLKC
jgi:hypothetical protein